MATATQRTAQEPQHEQDRGMEVLLKGGCSVPLLSQNLVRYRG
jgi:hypothetical protein